jgi:alpha-tubulin suppressor-like RCC1 family protein
MKRTRLIGLCVIAAVALGTVAAVDASATSYGAWAWGFKSYDQLGDGLETGQSCPIGYKCSANPVAVREINNVTAVAGGAFHSLALLANGTVDAWGTNVDGVLGRETPNRSSVPLPVGGLAEVTAVTAGAVHNLALLSNGTVKAWGHNGQGQLGNGTTGDSYTPVDVMGLEHVKSISAGWEHSLALLENGKVMAWGRNTQGQLGDGSTTNSDVPVEVQGLSEVVAIAAGGFEDGAQSLALLNNGTVMAWGANEYGQLGNGNTTDSHVPVAVSSLTNVSAIAAGGHHSLALLGGGAVMAWGWNTSGALGIGNNVGPEKCGDKQEACSTTPVEVHGIGTATAISAGWFYSLALLSNHTATTWGDNIYDELGNGSNVQQSDLPVTVSNLIEVAGISAGGEHGLALRPAENPPEYGRCLKIGKGTGKYATATCTTFTTGEGSFEWYPGVVKRNFTVVKKESTASVTLETVTKQKIVCLTELSAGDEYVGTKEIANVVLVLTGCSSGGATCNSFASQPGEIVSDPLKGELGWEARSTEKIGLRLYPASGTQFFSEAYCGVAPYNIKGAVIGKVTANKMLSSATLQFAATGGKQQPESFEGGPTSVLEQSFLETSTQLGLKLTAVQASEEAIEANATA